MSARLIEIGQHQLHPTLRALSEAGATTDDADWIRRPGNAAKVAAFLLEQRAPSEPNPFAQSFEDQIDALRRANEEEGWGIPDKVIDHLAVTAPAWPKGRDSYRSLRIRFGEGSEGVARTFEAHAARIERVHGPVPRGRWEHLRSGKEHLRLLSGNASHKAVVEWIIVRLDANRNRTSIAAVRGPKSLADEGLVLAWLFPERAKAIDNKMWACWFCAGYELRAFPAANKWEDGVPLFNETSPGHRSPERLTALHQSNDSTDASVPVYEEPSAA